MVRGKVSFTREDARGVPDVSKKRGYSGNQCFLCGRQCVPAKDNFGQPYMGCPVCRVTTEGNLELKRPGTPTYPKTVGPWELEPHYSRHVGAMTSEGLHDKQDIAFQLALRDQRISVLESQLSEAELCCGHDRLAALSRIIRRTLACGQLEKLEDARPYLDDQPTPQRAGETESKR